MKLISQIIFLGMTLGLLTACDPNLIYEENLAIDNAAWNRNEKASFSFDIVDTTASYDFYLNIRHSGDYPYKNLYLFTHTRSPNGKLAQDTAQMVFANKEGRWMGKGIGDLYDYEFKFKERLLFPVKGTYTFEIEQAMRDKVIPNITDIGIRIQKLEDE